VSVQTVGVEQRTYQKLQSFDIGVDLGDQRFLCKFRVGESNDINVGFFEILEFALEDLTVVVVIVVSTLGFLHLQTKAIFFGLQKKDCSVQCMQRLGASPGC
jgi:hypothetical protein